MPQVTHMHFVCYAICRQQKRITRAEQDALDTSTDGPLEAFGDCMLFVLHDCSLLEMARLGRQQRAFWRFPALHSNDLIPDVKLRMQCPSKSDVSILMKLSDNVAFDENMSALLLDNANKLVVQLPTFVRRPTALISKSLYIYNPISPPLGVLKYGGRISTSSFPHIIFQTFENSEETFAVCCEMQKELYHLRTKKAWSGGLACQRPRLMTLQTEMKLRENPAILKVRPLFFEGLEVPSLEDVCTFSNMFLL